MSCFDLDLSFDLTIELAPLKSCYILAILGKETGNCYFAKTLIGSVCVQHNIVTFICPCHISCIYHDITGPHRGHSGRVVTLSPPTSEAGVRSP